MRLTSPDEHELSRGRGQAREEAEFARRDVEYHRRTAGSYDESVTREHAIYHQYSLFPFLDRVAASTNGGLAVDLGCGTGVVTIALAERGFRVIGIDRSPEMLEQARRKAEDAGMIGRIELRNEDILESPLPEGSADLVTCQGVLHHVNDLGACVRALARILRPRGYFYISEPCTGGTVVGRAIARGLRVAVAVRRRVQRRERTPQPESVEAPIRPRELFHALERSGLTYDAEYLTHIPLAHGLLPAWLRLRLTLLISRPWRRRKGDIVLVEGRKELGETPA